MKEIFRKSILIFALSFGAVNVSQANPLLIIKEIIDQVVKQLKLEQLELIKQEEKKITAQNEKVYKEQEKYKKILSQISQAFAGQIGSHVSKMTSQALEARTMCQVVSGVIARSKYLKEHERDALYEQIKEVAERLNVTLKVKGKAVLSEAADQKLSDQDRMLLFQDFRDDVIKVYQLASYVARKTNQLENFHKKEKQMGELERSTFYVI